MPGSEKWVKGLSADPLRGHPPGSRWPSSLSREPEAQGASSGAGNEALGSPGSLFPVGLEPQGRVRMWLWSTPVPGADVHGEVTIFS